MGIVRKCEGGEKGQTRAAMVWIGDWAPAEKGREACLGCVVVARVQRRMGLERDSGPAKKSTLTNGA
jgi:hypothetical protein